MCEAYTRQSLPTKVYRELLGCALCVFSSNNGFIIENILKTNSKFNWYQLTDKESGNIADIFKSTIFSKCRNTKIVDLFYEIVEMRNRIIHGFRITSSNGDQVLATKTKIKDGNKQFEITEDYLKNFIRKNGELSILLHAYRGY